MLRDESPEAAAEAGESIPLTTTPNTPRESIQNEEETHLDTDETPRKTPEEHSEEDALSNNIDEGADDQADTPASPPVQPAAARINLVPDSDSTFTGVELSIEGKYSVDVETNEVRADADRTDYIHDSLPAGIHPCTSKNCLMYSKNDS